MYIWGQIPNSSVRLKKSASKFIFVNKKNTKEIHERTIIVENTVTF